MTNNTLWAPAFTEVAWALPEILKKDNRDRAVEYLEQYFSCNEAGSPNFTGSLFERGTTKSDKITAEDLLALSLLDVPVPGYQVAHFLSPSDTAEKVDLDEVATRNFTAHQLPYHLGQITKILSTIPTDVALSSKKAGDLMPAGEQLWVALRRKGFGSSRVSKLMARKRPKLFPIIDSVVAEQLDTDSLGFYANLRTVLRAENKALNKHLKDIRAAAAGRSGNDHIADLSPIRVFDIVVWMSGRKQA